MAKHFLDEGTLRGGVGGNFPVKFQLESLGLDKHVLETMRGRKVLDIGCGNEARLVQCLRQKGVLAEGIDGRVKPSDYLISQKITAEHPLPGCIPRPSGFYDFVLAHGVESLDHGLTKFAEVAPEILAMAGMGVPDLLLERAYGGAVLFEALRVLNPGGRFVVRPGLNSLGGFSARLEAGGYKVVTHPVTRTEWREETEKYVGLARRIGLPRDYFQFMETRSVISRRK